MMDWGHSVLCEEHEEDELETSLEKVLEKLRTLGAIEDQKGPDNPEQKQALGQIPEFYLKHEDIPINAQEENEDTQDYKPQETEKPIEDLSGQKEEKIIIEAEDLKCLFDKTESTIKGYQSKELTQTQ